MNGLAAMVGLVFSPYWVTVERNVPNVVFINERVFAVQRMEELPTFFDRKTGKAMSFQEGFDLSKEYFRGTYTLAYGLGRRFGFARHTQVRGIEDDLKIGVGFMPVDALRTLADRNLAKTLPASGSLEVPIAWSGQTNVATLLPLPPTYASNSAGRDAIGGQWDYQNRKAVPSAIHGTRVVGHVHCLLNWPYSVYTAVMWDLGSLSGRSLQPAWADNSLASWIDGDHAVGWADKVIDILAQGTSRTAVSDVYAVLWNIKSNDVTRLRIHAMAHCVRDGIQVGHTLTKPRAQTVQPNHAAMWRGTPDSYVNLHPFVPEDVVSTTAFWIGKKGEVYGIGTTKSRARVGIEWRENPIFKLLKGS